MDTPTITCEEFQSFLPDWLDDDIGLAAAVRSAANAHVAGCPACAALVADLRTIVRDAGSLPVRQPSRDLWSGIEARIEAPVLPLAGRAGDGTTGEHAAAEPSFTERRLRVAPAWHRMAVAASLLVAVTAGVTYTLARHGAAAPQQVAANTPAPAQPASGAAPGAPTVRTVARPSAEETYDKEIASLRAIVDARQKELSPATVAVLRKNLKLIDAAIAESKAALANDPASTFLTDRLTQAYDTKLRLLRSLATLPSHT